MKELSRAIALDLRLAWLRLVGPASALTVLVVAAIGSAVALATGLQMSARSIESSMRASADALIGEARLEVTGAGVGIAEDLLPEIQALSGVASASPLLEATARTVEGGIPLHLIGVDLLAERQVRANRITASGLQIRDPLRLVAVPGSIIAGTPLLRALGLREGSRLAVRAASRSFELTVQGTLEPDGLGRAYAGQVAITDVFGLQSLVGRAGWLDRIDVVPKPGVDPAMLARSIDRVVAGRGAVRPSSYRTRFVDESLGVLRVALQLFVALGLGVAALLAYAAMSLSVQAREAELRVLRASGMEPGRARRGILLEAALLSATGGVAGLLIGVPLAAGFLHAFSRFAVQSYHLSAPSFDPQLDSLVVGILVAVGAALPAAIVGTHQIIHSPSAAAAAPTRSRTGLPRVATIAGLVTLALLASMALPALGGGPRAVLTLAGALGAIGLATPILLLALRSRARWFERMLPGIGHLVGTWLSARPLGASFAIVSIAAIVAAGSGVLLTVHSISQSFVSTAETRFPDALLVSVGSMFDMSEREPLLRETVAEIARVPGVIDLDEQYGRGRTLLFRGEEVGIFAQRMSTAARRATLPVLSGRADEVALRIARGAVGISDGFARHFGVEVGDAIELATSRGLRRFAVGGVIRDHQGPAGSLFFDLDVFDAWWPREGVWTLVLWTDGAPESLIDAIRRSVDTDQALFFAHGSALRELYRDWIGQFVDLLYVVVGVSAALGGLALTTQLVGIVAERGRELALLRAAGASPGQLSASILVEGLIVALLGAGMGLPAGIALSRPLSDYVVESYGWSLRPAVEVPELALMLAATLLIAAAPALYPAVRARHPLEASLLQPEG